MAFEFLFGLFGLISSDSKSRHKSRLESEWRLPTPLNANLFREAGLKSPLSGVGSPTFKSPGSPSDSKRPIFSTTGTLAGAKSSSEVSDGLFSSTSSSSASSIASSGSNLTTNSTSAFIKPSGEQTKKYEFRLNLIGGEKNSSGSTSTGLGTNASNSSTGTTSTSSAQNLKLGSDETLGGLGGLGKHSSPVVDLLSEGQAPEASSGAQDDQEPTSTTNVTRSQQLRKFYCLAVCATLWLHVFRLIIGLLVDKSLVTLDFYSLGAYKIHFLIPAMCLAIQAAAVSTLFIRNNDETNWLVPFYSSKDYLIRSRSNFKPKIEDYTKRVNISVVLALALALVSSISLSAYLIHCVGQSELGLQQEAQAAAVAAAQAAAQAAAGTNKQQTYATQYETLTTTAASSGLAPTPAGPTTIELLQQAPPMNASAVGPAESAASPPAPVANRLEQAALATLLTLDVVWAIYSTYICFLVSFYFNLICAIMKSRFHGISKIIEDLAESNTTKTTNQARKITTLYLEHNEACELLDESNDFWQYLIFFTYFTYIPAYCYCLYNLFFVDFEAWPSFITWVIHTHTGFIILLISFSAAGVSTEAHAPYTSLHTLSLIQLPLDVEVNIATFLHRVRGLTIGYSCYDLFAITNASMSNTAAACASYFLIVADFSRSSVFTLAQMNGTAKGGTPGSPTPAH